jgi:hypothetical protein
MYDEKIIIWGMSCVGKTTFAKRISKSEGHQHICFDAHFPWHAIEALGMAPSSSLKHIVEIFRDCPTRFVVDGWHLSGPSCIPDDVAVYVLVAQYHRVINQYRVPVDHQDQHLNMYKKWYLDPDFGVFPNVRYWENNGEFLEIDHGRFTSLSNQDS